MSARAAEVVTMKSETVDIEEVTPDLATEWLEGNTHNRGVRQATVARYARDMEAGKWLMTGEAIKFTADGTLLDGQHRLWAVIEANQTVRMMVVRNIDPTTQDVMDSGLKRTAADALGLAGYSHRVLLASTANLGIALEKGINARGGGLGRAGENSHSEIIEWVNNNPSILDAVRSAHSQYTGKIDAPPTALAYALWEITKVNPDRAVEFFEGMASLSTRGEGDPRLAAVRFFMRARRDRLRISHTIALSVIYRTWNAWRKGKSMKSIRTEVNGKIVGIPDLVH